MSNEYFTPTGNPAANSTGSSSLMRSEFANISAGFDKLPTLSGNGGEVVAVNAGATAMETLAVTGTGAVVRAASPTIAGGVTETVYSLTGTDIDPDNGGIQEKTLSGNWTVTANSFADGQSVLLHITKGAHTITWPGGIKWINAVPSLSATVTSVVVMWKVSSVLCACYIGDLV